MGKRGPKLTELDIKTFEGLCGLQCTEKEICDFFGITDKTLASWCNRTYGRKFSEVFDQKRGTGKISLRRMQWRLAEKNAAMAIFLGKQYLGQRDNVDVSVNRPDDDALKSLEQRVKDYESGGYIT